MVTVRANEAMVLCLNLPAGSAAARALPSGPFAPQSHRTFDLALRAFVHDQTGFDLGYVEQLYSFGDQGRETTAVAGADRVISISYLALTPDGDFTGRINADWVPFHHFFPWEDWRSGELNAALDALRPALDAWADTDLRRSRVATLLPTDFDNWNEERVLDRYELLYEAGLIAEAGHGALPPHSGEPMASDHRRILATALSRLRGKVKYRPVIFELMSERFTLLELQKSLEALTGVKLHKQNFRRALERTGFVEALGILREDTGGRPAELYRYDRDRFRFSPSSGLSLPRV
ncbi:NAD regulator [Asticcacaulis sp. AC402]|nr:NAD regulator [Asticcacaulis sp. AC402]